MRLGMHAMYRQDCSICASFLIVAKSILFWNERNKRQGDRVRKGERDAFIRFIKILALKQKYFTTHWWRKKGIKYTMLRAPPLTCNMFDDFPTCFSLNFDSQRMRVSEWDREVRWFYCAHNNIFDMYDKPCDV